MTEEVIRARIAVGLRPRPFTGDTLEERQFEARHGEPIVCRCVNCGTLFKSASFDLADVEFICNGDCGCSSKGKAA